MRWTFSVAVAEHGVLAEQSNHIGDSQLIRGPGG